MSSSRTWARTRFVKPKHLPAPGEYAFYVRMPNTPTGQAWDFGVDQK